MTERYVLGNGMTVLIKEMHHAPVASFWVWYRVGSGDETPGKSGSSHWVEHMLFKGTPQFPKGEIDRRIARCGGALNGMTWLDFTTYMETLPSQEIDLAFRIEADRMVNALFEPPEVEAERTVILSERAGAENDPCFLLDEEVRAASFRLHAYRTDAIGELCDLQAMTRDDLWQHYRTYYAPSNAIAVLVGDLDGQVALDRIRALFGPIPAGSPIPVTRRPEPQQRGERRIVREGEGSVAYLQAAYHAPQASAADFLPLMVMDAVLTGPASMSFSGDGAANRSSRLYKALIETELATDVGGSLAMTRDPYLYDLSVTVRSGHSLPEVEGALFAELDTLAAESISEDELHKAVKQCKAQLAYATEQATNQAWWLGWAETVDGYTWFESFIERLARVTIDDVGIAARRCLAPANRTVGWYVPDPSQDEEQGSVVHID